MRQQYGVSEPSFKSWAATRSTGASGVSKETKSAVVAGHSAPRVQAPEERTWRTVSWTPSTRLSLPLEPTALTPPWPPLPTRTRSRHPKGDEPRGVCPQASLLCSRHREPAALSRRSPGGEENREKVRRILGREEVRRAMPNDVDSLGGKTPCLRPGETIFPSVSLKATPELTGRDHQRACQYRPRFQSAHRHNGNDSEGHVTGRITGANVNNVSHCDG